ncbi:MULTISPECIES: ethylbenzene dehydrogenase-related protein [Bradyrhizobium]|uniref:Cytochrome b subunit of formate dehydrogenase n=2 Tax=Bradyrhizobium TaxID=374 RepID=A0ABY0PI06_9BRAD|nr:MULTISPECIES: ethylbenzene dehydrogenase-related protein [Bradyrhizobium]SDI43060.1 Cytochrome b subunit of formate dehydrogenase [Bradyrhizobium ottawaense]SED53816.1 Cytochrome b subunit of formate dehydrogenase [Bradyrhizobium lablabi]SHL53151.1 Cytochrome b subunit of formate dehydrogenase [Bradyrhizobium lablabi]
MRPRRTDYGTIILHWLFVAAFAVALFSGLRIATEAPDRTWINLFDVLLPRNSVWTAHMQAAVVLVALTLAYIVYVIKAGLGRRIQLDRVRLRGLFGRGQSRLSAVNACLYWIFFVTMLALLVSGGLLYFGLYSGYDVAMLHWVGTWVILAFAVLHVVTHYKSGGASQLLRIFRPAPLPAPPPRLDAVELLNLLMEQQAAHPIQPRGDFGADRATEADPAPRENARKARSKSPTLQANAFVVAAAVAITGASMIMAADRMSVDHLQIHRITPAEAPTLDGDTSDRAWRSVKPFALITGEGGNFDGKGESRIEIRAVQDGTWAYFLFTWEDPTRSLKHLPLVKEADGWHLLRTGYDIGDEHDYNEDKFSVLLTTSDGTLAGDRTFHAGPHPIPNAPATMTGRGLHFTESGYVDVWQWKATSGGPTGWMDDAHIGPPVDPTPMQAANIIPYRGGFAPDPGTVNYRDNFTVVADTADGTTRSRLIAPLRLPRDVAAMAAAMGNIDLDPNHGESEGARWFMTEAETVPYSADADAQLPIGTVIPGVIVDGEFSGDRADIRCAARWASGHWALEVARRLDTGSEYDVPIRSGVFMRVAAFDHSQIRHTRHVRPIRIEVE